MASAWWSPIGTLRTESQDVKLPIHGSFRPGMFTTPARTAGIASAQRGRVMIGGDS